MGLYLGAGGGLHWLNTELAQALAQGVTPPSGNSDLVPFLETTAKPSALGVAGLRLSAPAFPLAVFEQTTLQGRAPAEVARTLNLSIEAVYMAKSRTLQHLQKIVARLERDW